MYCFVAIGAIVELLGVTTIEVRTGGTIVIVVWPVSPLKVADTVALPTETPLAKPQLPVPLPTVTIEALPVAHTAEEVMFAVGRLSNTQWQPIAASLLQKL